MQSKKGIKAMMRRWRACTRNLLGLPPRQRTTPLYHSTNAILLFYKINN